MQILACGTNSAVVQLLNGNHKIMLCQLMENIYYMNLNQHRGMHSSVCTKHEAI